MMSLKKFDIISVNDVTNEKVHVANDIASRESAEALLEALIKNNREQFSFHIEKSEEPAMPRQPGRVAIFFTWIFVFITLAIFWGAVLLFLKSSHASRTLPTPVEMSR